MKIAWRDLLKRALGIPVVGLVATISILAGQPHETVADKVTLRYPELKWAMEVELPGFTYVAPYRFDPFSGMATAKLFRERESGPPLSVVLGIAPVPKGGSTSSELPFWIPMIEKEQGIPKGKWKVTPGRYERRREEPGGFSSGGGPGLESLGRSGPAGAHADNAWAGKGGGMNARARSHEIHLYDRGGYIAYALLTQDWIADGEAWKGILGSVRFVDLPEEVSAWTVNGDRIRNEVLLFSFSVPEGTTFQPDKKGIFAEGKGSGGALSIRYRAERCSPCDEGSLRKTLKAEAEKRMLRPSSPKDAPLKTVGGTACYWRTASNESLTCTWLVCVRDNLRCTFECQGPPDRERDTRDLLTAIGSTLEWAAP